MQPYVLLGLELQARGHAVTIATEERMQGLVQQLGGDRLSFRCISGDPTGMLWEKKYQVGPLTACTGSSGWQPGHTVCQLKGCNIAQACSPACQALAAGCQQRIRRGFTESPVEPQCPRMTVMYLEISILGNINLQQHCCLAYCGVWHWVILDRVLLLCSLPEA